ncbi:unnamed protein product [Moneuplotes crassus]|uniref:Uncharacterized protein n=1 Tax=Euplotes crassus TaxID=5936 RepID=A0AAD1UJW3_EUPCR|nr:unnamed protein product [Moneuplotes crassus]
MAFVESLTFFISCSKPASAFLLASSAFSRAFFASMRAFPAFSRSFANFSFSSFILSSNSLMLFLVSGFDVFSLLFNFCASSSLAFSSLFFSSANSFLIRLSVSSISSR